MASAHARKTSLGHSSEQGVFITVELRLSDVKAFFNSLDPSPFLERDLDDRAADYITESVREQPLKEEMRLRIYLPKRQLSSRSEKAITQAIQNYYGYMLGVNGRRLRNLLKDGRKSLFIGFSFLAVCMLLSEVAVQQLSGFLSRILGEGFLIAGWVALWHPISIFLYGWWPLTKERKVFEKIKAMPVELKPVSPSMEQSF